MENALFLKLKEFMTVLDQVKKYRTLLTSLPDFAIIIALSIILALFTMILSNLDSVYISQSSGLIKYNYFIIFLFTGILVGTYWVNRKVKSVKVGQWKEQLDEGLPGGIKLLQELNWDNIFSDIRHAKLGYWLYGVTKIIVYWMLTVIVFWLFCSCIEVFYYPVTNRLT